MKIFILMTALLSLSTQPGAKNNSHQSAQPKNARYAEQPAFTPLHYGAIQPQGWLRDWCVTAKNGLVTHNKAFDKGWIDGQPTASFLNEQTAYWIDGMLRLGIVMHDPELIRVASADIKSVISHNYLGPSSWSSAVYARGIIAYYLYSGDKAALKYLSDFFRSSNLTGFYEYEHGKDPNDAKVKWVATSEPRNLVQTEPLFEAYANGAAAELLPHAMDALKVYQDHFVGHWNGDNLDNCVSGNGCINSMHGVSYNEFAKLWAIAYLFNGDKSYLSASVNAYRFIDSLHMMPHGVNSAMENLMGVGPTVGTETCDVADFINSNTWMYRITGKGSYGDRIEKAFFNAAPAAVAHDFKKLVYMQSPNNLDLKDKFAFEEVHNPKCCSGNQARLLPNYILHMLMATADNGLAFNLYGPCKAQATVGHRTTVQIASNTSYPFTNLLNISISPEHADTFPIYLRIPEWCKNYHIQINGKNAAFKANADGFVRINRQWSKADQIKLIFDRTVELKDGVSYTNGAVASLDKNTKIIPGRAFQTVEYGPLLFALNVPKGTPYKFALSGRHFTVEQQAFPAKWNWNDVPLSIDADALPVNWANAPELPEKQLTGTGKSKSIRLIPYGSTEGTRITMFPKLN